VHWPVYQAHDPQVAAMVLGPVPVPGRQRLRPGHQPHEERAVQAPQSAAEAQRSVGVPASVVVAVHCEESHDQPLAHDGPIVGASRPPVWQRPVAPQKPHDALPVHAPQVVADAQGSPASAAAVPVSAGEPASTGVVVPVSGVTVPASTAEPASTGVVVPVSGVPASTTGQRSGAEVQPEAQAPAEGPVALPPMQVPVAPHQPQGPRLAQVPHWVTAPQFTGVTVGVSIALPRSGVTPESPTCVISSPFAQPTAASETSTMQSNPRFMVAGFRRDARECQARGRQRRISSRCQVA
jgi:hypothetical protein